MQLSFIKKLLLEGFYHSIISVKPSTIINTQVKLIKPFLTVSSTKFKVENNNCILIGFGKAVLDMGKSLELILGDQIKEGILSVPSGIVENRNYGLKNSKIKVYESSFNNQPDMSSIKATEKIVNLVKKAEKSDLIIVLISGGGSALLTMPVGGISFEEKLRITQLLAKAGASISELNTVRKSLSAVKGGKLALMSKAPIVSFILSDIVGDPIEFIASGPTCISNSSSYSAKEILQKYNLLDTIPVDLLSLFETPSIQEKTQFAHVANFIVGSNKLALNSAKHFIGSRFKCEVVSSRVEGSVEDVCELYGNLADFLCRILEGEDLIWECKRLAVKLGASQEEIEALTEALRERSEEIVLIFGGEPTVCVKGNGKGGRNQELALRFSCFLEEKLKERSWRKQRQIVFLSGGTDGADGPTDAAGALAYPGQTSHLDPRPFLQNNDSYTYFSKLGSGEDHIKTGMTGTNVMDVHILAIFPQILKISDK